MEYQQSWGAERVARWAEAIQRRGGELEPVYCARVTHVLCETQKHGVVMQVTRSGFNRTSMRKAEYMFTVYYVKVICFPFSVAFSTIIHTDLVSSWYNPISNDFCYSSCQPIQAVILIFSHKASSMI